MTTLTRKIWCEPEYGQSVHIRFTVTGEHGAIDFHFVPCDEGENFEMPVARINARGVEQHSRKPHYESQKPDAGECWLIGGDCYHDGSYLYAAETLLPGFLKHGEKWLWGQMEHLYNERFKPEESE